MSPFTITLGDEFQAVYGGFEAVLGDTVEIIAEVYPHRLRMALGHGPLSTDLNPTAALGMDGPCFAAAIEGWKHNSLAILARSLRGGSTEELAEQLGDSQVTGPRLPPQLSRFPGLDYLLRFVDARELGGVEPCPAKKKACHNLGVDGFGAVGVLHELLAVLAVEAMRQGLGIENPVLANAVLLVFGELRPDIAVGGPGTQYFHNQIGRPGQMGRSDGVFPTGSIECQVR